MMVFCYKYGCIVVVATLAEAVVAPVIVPCCIPSPPLAQESCWSSCTCSQKSLLRPLQSSLTSWRGSASAPPRSSGESPCVPRRERLSVYPSTWPCPHRAPSPQASGTWQSPVLAGSSQSPVASDPASPDVAGSLTPASGGALTSNII